MRRRVLLVVLPFIVCAVCALQRFAGGVNPGLVCNELAGYVGYENAGKIVRKDIDVKANTLSCLSDEHLSDDSLTVLLMHPNFPQSKRTALIQNGRDGWYFWNACHCGIVTDDDVKALVERRSLMDFFSFGQTKVTDLQMVIQCRKLSDETRQLARGALGGLAIVRLRDCIQSCINY